VEITLALGGGGVKGYAHLGVIRALERLGFAIKGIAGTSAGGMAAAVYAAGFSPSEILAIVTENQLDGLYGFRTGPALLRAKGITQALSHFLSEERFEDLIIPCALTAVDLKGMNEVVLGEGRVLDAVLATIAIPGIFPPQEWNDCLLVDGMVLDPVPVRVARSLAPDLGVIAVSLTPVQERWKEVSPYGSTSNNPLLRQVSRLRFAKAFEIYHRCMDMTLHMLSEIRLEVDQPEVVIRPDVGHIAPLENVDVHQVAALGEEAVEAVYPALMRILEEKKPRIRRRSEERSS
jgi:NTE family protein